MAASHWLALLLLVALSLPDLACGSPLQARLDQVEFRETPLQEAIDYLRSRSLELDPAGKGTNFVIDQHVDPDIEVSLLLHQVSIGVAMICLVEQAELDYRLDEHACIIVPRGQGTLAEKERRPAGNNTPSPQAAMARQLMLKRIAFVEASLADVLQFLSAKSREGRSDGSGINLVVNYRVDQELPVTLDLSEVAASFVLRQVSDLTGVEIRIEPYAIFIDPPGTRLLREARLKQAQADAKASDSQNGRASRQGRPSIGNVPNDPRSPAHPDYVKSTHPDVSKRTNAMNNVYKWVNGKWTFVRSGAGAGDKSGSGLDSAGSLRTPGK